MSQDSLVKITSEIKSEVEKLHKSYELLKIQLKQEYSEKKIDKRTYYNNILSIGEMIKHDNKNLNGCSIGLNDLKRKNFTLCNFQQIEFSFQGLLVDIIERHRLILERMETPYKMIMSIPNKNHRSLTLAKYN